MTFSLSREKERGAFSFFLSQRPSLAGRTGEKVPKEVFPWEKNEAHEFNKKIKNLSIYKYPTNKTATVLKKYSAFFASLLADFSLPFHRDWKRAAGKETPFFLFFERVEVR